MESEQDFPRNKIELRTWSQQVHAHFFPGSRLHGILRTIFFVNVAADPAMRRGSSVEDQGA